MKIKKLLFWLFVAFASFLVGVLLMNFIIMPLIVRQGNIVMVPDVTEMELTEAEKILKSIDNIKEGSINIETREKVLPYSWENICKRLVRIYEEMTL